MSKSDIAVIVDSTCDLPKELVEQHNIYVVPQHLIWGKEDLLDGVDITPDEFYKRLGEDPIHPKTSQPIAREFADVVEKAKADGAKKAVIMTLSNKLSGTHDSAVGTVELASKVSAGTTVRLRLPVVDGA